MPEHVDAVDARRVHEERSLHSDAVGHAPHREVLAQAASRNTDDRAFEHLDALPRALHDLGVNLDRVAGPKRRHLRFLLLFLELLDDVHLLTPRWIYISAGAQPARGAGPLAACATAGCGRGRRKEEPRGRACRGTPRAA